jgi:hypothetical protein
VRVIDRNGQLDLLLQNFFIHLYDRLMSVLSINYIEQRRDTGVIKLTVVVLSIEAAIRRSLIFESR